MNHKTKAICVAVGLLASSVVPAGAKDYTPEISGNEIHFGEITEDSKITIPSGTTVTSPSAISGSGSLLIDGGGILVLSAESPEYEGEIIADGVVVRVAAAKALGTGQVTVKAGASQLFFAGGSFGQTFENDFMVEGSTSGTTFYFDSPTAVVKFSGSVTGGGDFSLNNPHADTGGADTAQFDGPVNVVGTITVQADGRKQTNYTFNKPVRAGKVYAYGNANSSLPYVWLNNANNSIGIVSRSYKGNVFPGADNAYGGGVLSAEANTRANTYLSGYSQEVAYISSSVTKADLSSISTSAEATLTLTGGVTSASCPAIIGLDGPLSLVVDDRGEDGTFTQSFTGGENVNGKGQTVMTISGEIEVKRGNLSFSGYYKLDHVPSIAVDNGSFNLTTTAEAALASLKTLQIGSSGKFIVGENTPNPFPEDSTMDLYVLDGAVMTLPADIQHIYVGYLYYNGKGVRENDYTSEDIPVIPEGVTVHVSKSPSEQIEEITWTGGAVDDSIVRAANWGKTGADLDITGDRYLATFASAGISATVSGAVSFHGLVFSGDGFVLRSSGENDEVGVYSAGICFADDQTGNADSHTYTIEPNLVFKTPLSVQIPVNDSLVLPGGLTMTDDIGFSGAGAVSVGGESSINSKLTMSAGTFFLTGVFGESENENGQIELPSGTQLQCSNAVVNCKISTNSTANNGSLRFMGSGTNYVTKAISAGTKSYYFYVDPDSTVVLEGGVSGGQKTWFGNGGTTIVRTQPAAFGVSVKNPLSTQGGGGKLILRVANNSIPGVKPGNHPFELRTEVSWALNGEAGVDEYELHARGKLDVANTRQRIKSFKGVAGGLLTGDAGGLLELTPGANETDVIESAIEGAVSLSVNGASGSCVVLTNQSFASKGGLEVSGGTLELGVDATWLNGTNFVVRGSGVLKFSNEGQLDKKYASLNITENGKVYVPTGVTLKVGSLFLNDSVRVAPGTYSASSAGFGNIILGGGSIRVGGGGIVLIVR